MSYMIVLCLLGLLFGQPIAGTTEQGCMVDPFEDVYLSGVDSPDTCMQRCHSATTLSCTAVYYSPSTRLCILISDKEAARNEPLFKCEGCDFKYYEVGIACQDCGAFKFAKTFGRSMVLQRAPARASVWGYTATVGATVTVTMGTETYTTTSSAGASGSPTWRVQLNPQQAGGPHTIQASSVGCTITLGDVMFGDVYMCVGQSNMLFRVNELINPSADIADSVHYPNVRTFRNSLITSSTPLYDVTTMDQGWAQPDGGTNIATFSAVCWLFGRNLNRELGVPIGLIQSAWGATRIEAWTSPDGLRDCFTEGIPTYGAGSNAASALWNAMIHPFTSHTIYGAIWYQGESNRYNAEKYGCLLKAMVGDWRAKWYASTGQTDRLFPFGQVQLAPYLSANTGFPTVRWSQTYTTGYTPNPDLQKVYTAVAIDLPDFVSPSHPIHPRYKRQIAERLMYGVLQVGYGDTSEGAYQGPIPTSVTVNLGSTSIRVEYDHGTAVLEQRATNGFEFCCATRATDRCPDAGTWTVATVTTTSGSVVTVTNPCGGQSVTGMRYLWAESPCALEQCPIYRTENELPAPPFKMDI